MNRCFPRVLPFFAVAAMVVFAATEPGPLAAQERAESVPLADGTSAEATNKTDPEKSDPSVSDPKDDPLYEAEFKKRETTFKDARQRLRDALSEQRAIYIRYLNLEDRNPAANQAYFDKRQEVRKLLDETYTAALELVRIGGDQESVQYLVTLIEHRLKRDIYDMETLEGATRLIDGGSSLMLLFQATARSAVVSGEFEIARKILGALDEEKMDDIEKSLKHFLDDYQKAYEKEAEIRKREAEEDRLPRVLLKTTQGDVVIELFLDQAPSTVANFIGLVEQGFYDGLDFYQVLDHLLAMTGDPTGLGNGSSGKFIVDEHDRSDARAALRGSLVMAKLPAGEPGKYVADSASSQFTILYLPIFSVTQSQTVFGRVIEGMDAISRLQRINPNKEKEKNAVVMPPDRIIEATVIRRPEKLPEVEYR